jgi:hypothetical protein
LAAVLAAVSITLVWRETQRRMAQQEFYVAPLTLFRRELSLAGICTIAAVITWALLTPNSVRFAPAALFPVFLYIFMMLRDDSD